jgi:acyl dehydratase
MKNRPMQLYAEDVVKGLRFQGDVKILTSEMYRQFAVTTGDRHPIHYDNAYAAKTKFGRPPAHGLLLTALTALGSTNFSDQLEDAMIAMVEQRMEFLRPAFAGDELQAEYEVVSNVISESGRSARVEIAVLQDKTSGERLVEGCHAYILRCRDKAT